MKKMIRFLLLLAIVIQYPACGSKEEYKVDEFEVTFELPSLVDITQGGEYTFNVKDGKSPSTTDSFFLNRRMAFRSSVPSSVPLPVVLPSGWPTISNRVITRFTSKEIPEKKHSGRHT